MGGILNLPLEILEFICGWLDVDSLLNLRVVNGLLSELATGCIRVDWLIYEELIDIGLTAPTDLAGTFFTLERKNAEISNIWLNRVDRVDIEEDLQAGFDWLLKMNIPGSFHVKFRGPFYCEEKSVEALISKINESTLQFTTELKLIGNPDNGSVILLGDKVTSLTWVMEPERGWPPKIESTSSCSLDLFLSNSIRDHPPPDIHQSFNTFKLMSLELDNYTIDRYFCCSKLLNVDKIEFRNCDVKAKVNSDKVRCTAREVIVYMSDCLLLDQFDFTNITRLGLLADPADRIRDFALCAVAVLPGLTTLKALAISDSLFITHDILQLLKQLQNLEAIQVETVFLPAAGIDRIFPEYAQELSKACPNLNHVSYGGFSGETVEYTDDSLNKLRHCQLSFKTT